MNLMLITIAVYIIYRINNKRIVRSTPKSRYNLYWVVRMRGLKAWTKIYCLNSWSDLETVHIQMCFNCVVCKLNDWLIHNDNWNEIRNLIINFPVCWISCETCNIFVSPFLSNISPYSAVQRITRFSSTKACTLCCSRHIVSSHGLFRSHACCPKVYLSWI